MRSFRRKVRGPAVPLGVCIAYLLLQLAPRFDMVSHVHEDGGRPHHHGFLSAHDVALERAALELLPEGIPHGQAAAHPRTTQQSRLVPLEAGTAGIAPASARAHTHYQEDPNLLGWGTPEPPSASSRAMPAPPVPATARPPETAPATAQARAPPLPS